MRLRRWNRTLRRHVYTTDQPVTADLPDRPAALRIWTGGVAWALALDFDAKHHGAAAVARHADDAARLLTDLGARVIIDVAASGGRHVWAPLAIPMTLAQAQQLTTAGRSIWPTLDPSPTLNTTDGCLTAPGSRCKDHSYRQLVTPLPEALQAVTQRSEPQLIDRALQRLAGICSPPRPQPHQHIDPHAVATSGGARPLSPLHTRIAEHGTWPDRTTATGTPWTRSEACYAVLCAAARRGHSQADILTQLDTGRWPGLLTLYTGRYGRHWRRRLRTEWAKAHQAASTSTHPPQDPRNTGGAPASTTEHDHAQRWLTIMQQAIDQLVPDRGRHNAHALINGLAWLSWRTGRRHIEAGTRSYARACAGLLDHTTAAAILRQLRELPTSHRPIERRSTGRGTHGDLYELVIPPAYSHLHTDPNQWPDPRPIPGIFGVRDRNNPRQLLLGATGWRLHQALTSGATGTAAQLARAAGISRAEAYNLLPTLVTHRLARREPGNASSPGGTVWSVGDHTPNEAGGAVGAPQHLAQLDNRHRHERQQWRHVLARYAARRTTAQHTTPDPDEPLWWPPDWEAEPPPPEITTPPDEPTGRETEAAALALLEDLLGARLLQDAPQRPKWLRHQRKRELDAERLNVIAAER